MSQFSTIIERADDARSRIREIAQVDLAALGKDWTFLDVRDQEEFKSGHFPDSIHLPLTDLEHRVVSLIPEKSKKIVTVCAAGHRSAIAADLLQSLGYAEVVSLQGGLTEYLKQFELSKVA